MAQTRPWKVSDELWKRAHPLIPPRPLRPKGDRPPEDDRLMFEAILFVLRTDIQCNALPRAIGASTTVYDRFRLWVAGGCFHALWEAGLYEAFLHLACALICFQQSDRMRISHLAAQALSKEARSC